jgi:signal transduction histidine kinase
VKGVFNFLKIYRLLCLAVTLFVINNLRNETISFNQYYLWFFAYLSIGSIFFFLGKKDHLLFFHLLLYDYIVVLLFQYFYPHIIILELIWMPVLVLLAATVLPVPVNFIFSGIMGIPGYIFLSYGNYAKISILIGINSYPYYQIALVFCIPVTLLSISIGFFNYYVPKSINRADVLQRLNSQLKQINRDVMDKVFLLQDDTRLNERKRISKEVHDTAGYVFINLIMMLQAAQAVFHKDQRKAETLIGEARDYAERGINEIRHILRDIRNYTTVFISLQNSLFNIGNSFQKATGVTVDINYGNWPRTFGKKLDSFFMSLMQEALTNAIKHGYAAAVSIHCHIRDSSVIMSIADNGIGCAMPVTRGIGISSIEEYVKEEKGGFYISSGSHGFTLNVSIPWNG